MMALAFAMADPEASTTMRDTLSTVMNKLIDYNRCTRKRNYSLQSIWSIGFLTLKEKVSQKEAMKYLNTGMLILRYAITMVS